MTLQHRHPSLLTALHQVWAQHQAVYERRRLRERPWLEDVLHWSPDGQLHGQVAPSGSGGPRSVTADGWCPGQG